MTLRGFAGWLYFWSVVVITGGILLYVANVPGVPDEDDLEMVSVHVDGIRLSPDFDGTDVVYLRAKDDERKFRYFSDFPMYVEMRDRVGINRPYDIWIDPTQKPGRDGAYTIWGFVEHAPRGDGSSVTFEQIVDEIAETERSWQTVGIALIGGGVIFILIGWAIRHFVPYRPPEPHA